MRLWIPFKRLGEPRDSMTGPSYCGTTHLSFIVSFPVSTTAFSSLQDNYSRTELYCQNTEILPSNLVR